MSAAAAEFSLSSLFLLPLFSTSYSLLLLSLRCAVCFNLFMVLHVSHSCATTSPNPRGLASKSALAAAVLCMWKLWSRVQSESFCDTRTEIWNADHVRSYTEKRTPHLPEETWQVTGSSTGRWGGRWIMLLRCPSSFYFISCFPLISFSTNLSPPHPISRHYIPLFIHLISFPPFSFNVLSVQYSVCATKIAVKVRCCDFHMTPIHLPWRKTVL